MTCCLKVLAYIRGQSVLPKVWDIVFYMFTGHLLKIIVPSANVRKESDVLPVGMLNIFFPFV